MDLACAETGRHPKSFSFRGVSPLAGMQLFYIQGTKTGSTLDLWAKTAGGDLAMSAQAVF